MAKQKVGTTVHSGPSMSPDQIEQEKQSRIEKDAASVPTGLKRGWCLFKAKRRCYVEGVLLERPGQTMALSAEASNRVRGNKHLQLVAGVFPEQEEITVLDEYGDPLMRGGQPVTKMVVKNKELLEVDGDPIVGQPPADFADEQYALRHALINGKKAPAV